MSFRGKSLRPAFGLATLVFLLAGPVSAQTATVGNLLGAVANAGTPSGVQTLVELSSSATAAGSLNSATFSWSSGGCLASVKIKFFRPSGDTLLFLTERGPFNSSPFTVALSPPVTVQAGDLIGVSNLSTTCGNPDGTAPGRAAGYVRFDSDVTTNVSRSSGQVATNFTLGLYASGPAAETVAGIVAVVVSSPGVGVPPSLFKTGVQMHNSTASAESGRLVFRRQGTSTAAGDASLSFSLAPGQAQSFDDLLPAMGLTGPQIGSLDVVMPIGAPPPVVAVRIFNEGGTAGTSGFTVGLTFADAVLGAGDRGVLFTPSDLARFRLNIGVRTGAAGAAVIVTRRSSAGVVVQTLAKVYPPNFFEQIAAGAFLSGAAFGANDSITIQVTAGSITVYGATADNISQDPSLQFATKAP